jgi:DNA-binding response OmpR family regulator
VTDPVASPPVWPAADGPSHSPISSGPVFRAGVLSLEPDARRVTAGGVDLVLTTMEYEIAARLIRSAGRVVPRDELIVEVFAREPSPADRALDVHVSHLRSKLGVYRWLIVTVRGVGYMCRATSGRSVGAWS